jgi:polysaccharide biosynthesis/export protein
MNRIISGNLQVHFRRWLSVVAAFVTAAGLAFHTAGCNSVEKKRALAEAGRAATAQTLSAGDVIKISFPGSPTLDATQQIRRDGRINLAVVGEVTAADKSPAQLEEELVKLYAPQLVSKEIKVTVVSSSFAVFVTGAVMKPGKITPDRAITALEAIMEAGGFDMTKANMTGVRVIRQEDGQTKNYSLNLKNPLYGKASEPFYLKSNDIVFVPEKFSWF